MVETTMGARAAFLLFLHDKDFDFVDRELAMTIVSVHKVVLVHVR